MSSSSFCDECGAALPGQAAVCVACGYPVDASLPLTGPARAPFLPSPNVTLGTLPPDFLLAQRYRIISVIGQGGFAHVYKAKDTAQRNRQVAIKQISLRGLSAREMIEATDTYNREIMYLSQLRHTSLPCIYEHFTDADHWYIVMEYIRGETLEDRLKATGGGHFSIRQVLAIGHTLCKVLTYLHDQKPSIIFRDLKPANIMITRKGRLYLIDFGIARQYRPQQRKDTTPFGSPGYAAPEQYGTAQTTIQTDVYGLGATLQTLLTGKEPLELLMRSEPPDPAVPQELQTLITRMLERDPGKRPRSIEEVRWSLQQVQEQSPGQKARRMLALLPSLLEQAASPMMLLVFMIGLSYLLFALAGPPFGIPYLLVVLGLFVGRSVYSLRQERDTTSHLLSRKEMLGIVCKRVPGSLFVAIFLALFFLFLYGLFSSVLIFQGAFGDPWFLGSVALLCILVGSSLGIRRMLRVRAAQRSTQQPVQGSLLQQHVQKRP